ncbi:MAG TPA: cell division protein FtsL, partial [Geminicoccaceae bacterium]
MTRLGVALLVALVLSGLWLVRVSYESRRLFSAIEKARVEERALAVDRLRLQAELRALATPIRVERTAREKLAMRQATAAVTHYATLRSALPAGSPAGSPEAAPPAT